MSSWNIAVVGASGQVGKALVDLLQFSNLSIDNIGLIGSDNSEGETVRVSGKNLTIENINTVDWSQYHIAFFAVNQSVSQQYARLVAQSGCIVIDASGCFAQEDNIPLVLPRINDSLLADFRNENIIAVANPVVSQALRTVATLTDIRQLLQLHITNLIPASFYGKNGVEQLANQSARLLNGLPAENELFNKQMAFNILPLNNALADEVTIIEEIRKITGDYQLSITIDAMLVPVFYGLTQSLTFTSSTPVNIDFGYDDSFGLEYGVTLMTSDYPTPVTQVKAEQEGLQSIHLADIRYNHGHSEQIKCFSVSDNIRFLGAQILLETAEKLLTEYL
ncbi:aspartate-semialdehyde dehydrogenase [Frischella sp. Ac48]|uniref:aspartate-semialdehyde dehydrogenase n=1 Tax=Frischella sp. Ac48 TaxID=2804531 RepID=UPI001C7D2BC7|nr:aspartate-semialdehyde dehydrogenase [Frischella sp. Ac48]MBX4134045.1 aspartate-semialdehyde dehydrogenase [Frischella sp. Ac48]